MIRATIGGLLFALPTCAAILYSFPAKARARDDR